MGWKQFLFCGFGRFSRPERGDFNNLIFKVKMGEPETPTDQAAVPEQPLDLGGGGVSDQVKVLGFPAEQKVTHAPPHQVSGEALSFQTI
jgi:hypothetical protein